MLLKPTECSCYRCRGACARKPCFPTPEQARRLLAAYPDKMVWDVQLYHGLYGTRPIAVMRPAAIGETAGETYDGDKVNGRCVFYKGKRCQLHHTDMKPLEGRLMSHEMAPGQISMLRGLVASMWLKPATAG